MSFTLSPQRVAIERFLSSHPEWVQESGSERTNFFVPGGQMYCVPPDEVGLLLRLQSECAAAGANFLLMERQLPAVPTALVIDVDADYVAAGGAAPAVGGPSGYGERTFTVCSQAIAQALYDAFDWEGYSAELRAVEPQLFAPDAARQPAEVALAEPNVALEAGVHVAYFVRPATKASSHPLAATGGWRDGLHIFVYVRADRAARAYLFDLLKSRLVAAISRVGGGRLVNGDGALDPGPLTAPIALYGSPSKKGGTVYRLAALHRLRFGFVASHPLPPGDVPDFLCVPQHVVGFSRAPPALPAGGRASAFLTIEPCAPGDLAAPAWELSLAHERPGGLVRKWAPPLRPECLAAAAALARNPVAPRGTAELLEERSFSNPTLGYWRGVVDLIDLARRRRDEWRNLVFAVASLGHGEEWELLGLYLSELSRHRDGRSRAAEFPALWSDACRRRGAVAVTWRSLLFEARRDNPERYRAFQENSNLERTRSTLLAAGGQITHASAASLLHSMFGDRYVAVTSDEPGRRYSWLELGHPGRDPRLRRPGDDWKWNPVGSRPDSLVNEIKGTLVSLVGQVIAQCLQHAEEHDRDQKDLIRNLRQSRKSLGMAPFIEGVIQLAGSEFVDYGFAERLDRDPNLMGVANGVLEVLAEPAADGRYVRLITGASGPPVSKYSRVAFEPDMSDPQHPARVRLRQVLGDIFGARLDWLMKYASLALRGGRKTNAFMVVLVGGGNNGKSVFLELMRMTLHEFGYKAPVTILTSSREKGNEANSAYAGMANRRFIYFSEPEGDGHDSHNSLRMARLKEMLSPEVQSTRDLRSRQINFVMEAVMFSSTNNDFTVRENNYSVWKRLVRISCDTRFVPNPHPDNPREKLEDPSIGDQYINNPSTQSAFLAELVDHFEELHRLYDGNIKLVPNRQVRLDTQYFRETQDVIHQFIRECVVRRAPAAVIAALPPAADGAGDAAEARDPRLEPGYSSDPTVVSMVQAYNLWRSRKGAGGRVPTTTGQREFADSEIGRHIYKGGDRRDYFRDLRILEPDESPAPGEERVVDQLEVPVRGAPEDVAPAAAPAVAPAPVREAPEAPGDEREAAPAPGRIPGRGRAPGRGLAVA